MKITTIGLDLAKNIFQIHGVDQHGKTIVRKQFKRAEMSPLLRQSALVPDRHGILRQRTPLGKEAGRLWPHR